MVATATFLATQMDSAAISSKAVRNKVNWRAEMDTVRRTLLGN